MPIYINSTGTTAQVSAAITAMTSTAQEATFLSSIQTLLNASIAGYSSPYFRVYGSAALTSDSTFANFIVQPLAFVDPSHSAVGELSPNKVT